MRKSLLVTWTYRANELVSMFTLGFIFLGIGFLIGEGELDPDQMAFMFVGYLAWFYTATVIGNLAWGLRAEMSAGTLEQMSMGAAPVGLILTARVMVGLLIVTAQIVVQGLVFFLLLGIRIPLHWTGLPVLAVMLVGLFGFGYAIAGATMVFKQFQSLANVVQNALLFLNGTMMPVDTMPGWLATFARTLPSTQAVVVLRRVLLDGRSLAAVWRDGSLVWLIVHSIVYLVAGWIVFSICERVAKAQGSLGQY
jgi:ABC-2 type transport system permease protein